ncbi:acetylornithine deacetylase [Ancylobacter aquaticus]|uniref:Acetylornithine deacetylase n=1 Tax=Ancylobacter aquaticus TaxID=100 RepID=A0A4R1I5V6_ANCAQ|nr:acetylornithine deacetylase [Ancylobacter aquaticus]TCK28019.1 acetylornithine deacetylase [Ancylobacter aquaticus]
MNVVQILERLVSFPSVVGTPNGAIVDWIAAYLESHSVRVHVLPGPEGDRANLFATLGPEDRPGYILSGHMDVVPAQEAEWRSDPFTLRAEGYALYGRGTSDMKGFLAAVLASVPALKAGRLGRPLHIAFSYDEEAGCRGAPHLISRLSELCAPPLGAIIGEPSGMRGVRAHKGKAAARIRVEGRAGHSSRPDQGINAIHLMAEVLAKAVDTANALAEGPHDPTFEPPYSSMQIGTIAGGQALNIVPDLCVADLEARAIPGIAPSALLEPVYAVVRSLAARGVTATWEKLSDYPALCLPVDAPLAKLVEKLTGEPSLAAVSYGTEAGLYQNAGIPSIICGPGDIARAHKPNEFIRLDELTSCQTFIEALGAALSHDRGDDHEKWSGPAEERAGTGRATDGEARIGA